MSDDLIRRSDAIKAVKSYLDLCCLTEAKFHKGFEDYNDEIATEIFEEIEPKRGEWIDMGDFEQCSVCKGTHLKEFQSYYGKTTWIKTPYCPNCHSQTQNFAGKGNKS